jgi:hypothetical protein
VRVEQAQPAPVAPRFEASAVAITKASRQRVTYKREVRDQLAHLSAIPPGPVRLEIAWVISPRRNWINLWKPTIDALTPLLGATTPDREWHPLDGRIVELGLHLHERAQAGQAIAVAVGASAVNSWPPLP